jgi:nucleoside-diphosphate-sugar epimerase
MQLNDTPLPIAVLTGATGFIGSHLADLLVQKGYEVRCIVRKGSNLQWLKDKPVACYTVGLESEDALAEVLANANLVFHVAGVVRANTEQAFYEGNVTTTQVIINALLKYAPNINRLLVVSSLATTGPAVEGQPVDEQTPLKPVSLYGRTKLLQEQLVQQYTHRLPITIVRPPAVYGERETDIYQFFKTYKQGFLPIAGLWGNKQLSMVHVSDLVAGIYLAATSPKSVGQVYFIGSEKQYTWTDVAHATQLALGKRALAIRLPHWSIYLLGAAAQVVGRFTGRASILSIEKAHEMTAAAWTCSSQKAAIHLGYKPLVSLNVGIAKTIAWYKTNKWL